MFENTFISIFPPLSFMSKKSLKNKSSFKFLHGKLQLSRSLLIFFTRELFPETAQEAPKELFSRFWWLPIISRNYRINAASSDAPRNGRKKTTDRRTNRKSRTDETSSLEAFPTRKVRSHTRHKGKHSID